MYSRLQASVLNQYAIYVLHLEKALQQVESAVLAAEAANKKSDKGLVPDDIRLGRYLLVSDGPSSVVTTRAVADVCCNHLKEPGRDRERSRRKRTDHLSQQTVSEAVKVPVTIPKPLVCEHDPVCSGCRVKAHARTLPQHTDATSHEFDGTMVILEQVDSIVRRIEDEKSSQEERQKTRDAIARVEGLENDKVSRRRDAGALCFVTHRQDDAAAIAPCRTQAVSSLRRGTSIQSAYHTALEPEPQQCPP